MVQCNKHLMIAIFTGAFHYGFLPAAALFSVVAGITLSCYSFKALVFLLTGSLSVSKKEMPEAMTVSVVEFIVGCGFSVATGGLFALYQMYQTKQMDVRNPRLMVPYDPESMANVPEKANRDQALNMTSAIFDLEIDDMDE